MPGAKQAYETTVKLMEMFRRGEKSDVVIEYLRNSAYKLAPDAQSELAGGTQDQYARKRITLNKAL